MNVLIVFDSYFGNTEKLSMKLGDAFQEEDKVSIIRVDSFKSEDLYGVKMLIVGSPTRAFNYTKKIKIFLQKLGSTELEDINVMAFDTRMDVHVVNNGVLTFMSSKFGYAAEKIGKKLKRKGGNLIGSTEGFFVNDSEGPLCEGEIDRAVKWVRKEL